jgi:chromosome segregation ATPase
LQSDVELRDQQIDALKTKLDALINGEASNQQQGTSMTSEATTQLIGMLKQQIQQLEEEKKASDAEDEKQNALIAAQAGQLTTQEEKLATQESEIKSLRRSLMNVMNKLGMK